MTDLDLWEREYASLKVPALNPVMTGFNVNIDRIITVSRDLLDSLTPATGSMAEFRKRLVHSMEHCTAEEWIVDDPGSYRDITGYFSSGGSLALGGQAGIAAAHLARLGAPGVTCVAPAMGENTVRMIKASGAGVLGQATGMDMVHTILEYSPDLIPLAEGAIPRNNRFIVSPRKSAGTTILTDNALAALIPRLSACTRAFLSGYQYLKTETEFREAAAQIQTIRAANPDIRVHIECVSATDPAVNSAIVHHILPVADSAGMNENELTLLKTKAGDRSPAGLAQSILELARETRISRIHLHTFGYYLLVIRKDRAVAETSRAALMYAALVVAKAAAGTGTGISPKGIEAVREIAGAFAPGAGPGIFTDGDYLIIAVPTMIATGITRTVGLGDILSSIAFVADRF